MSCRRLLRPVLVACVWVSVLMSGTALADRARVAVLGEVPAGLIEAIERNPGWTAVTGPGLAELAAGDAAVSALDRAHAAAAEALERTLLLYEEARLEDAAAVLEEALALEPLLVETGDLSTLGRAYQLAGVLRAKREGLDAPGTLEGFRRAAALGAARLDPARFPPDLVKAENNALAGEPDADSSELATDLLPAHASVDVDGTPAPRTLTLGPGTHLVAGKSPGFRVAYRWIRAPSTSPVVLHLERASPGVSAWQLRRAGFPTKGVDDPALIAAVASLWDTTAVLMVKSGAPEGERLPVFLIHADASGKVIARADAAVTPGLADGFVSLLVAVGIGGDGAGLSAATKAPPRKKKKGTGRPVYARPWFIATIAGVVVAGVAAGLVAGFARPRTWRVVLGGVN